MRGAVVMVKFVVRAERSAAVPTTKGAEQRARLCKKVAEMESDSGSSIGMQARRLGKNEARLRGEDER